jgi:phage gpG-like protein
MGNELYKKILRDIRTELSEEFDRNFERKAFFERAWPQTKFPNKRGSLMMRTGYLRRSMRSSIEGNLIRFSSSAIFADLHNSGGKIRVTAKMKRFFWAMYYANTNAQVHSVKTRGLANSTRNRRLSAEAAMWKAMALKPVGSTITIPARQFIGNHPRVDASVNRVVEDNLQELEKYMNSFFKKR